MRAELAIKASVAARGRAVGRKRNNIPTAIGQVNQKCHSHLILALVAGYVFGLFPPSRSSRRCQGVLPRAPNNAELGQVRLLDPAAVASSAGSCCSRRPVRRPMRRHDHHGGRDGERPRTSCTPTGSGASRSSPSRSSSSRGRSLTQDEMHRIENQALRRHGRRRSCSSRSIEAPGITVLDARAARLRAICAAAVDAQAPELQTEGQFDPDQVPASARQRAGSPVGASCELEQYYRDEIPQGEAVRPDDEPVSSSPTLELWRGWQDANDSAPCSFVAIRPQPSRPPTRASPTAICGSTTTHTRPSSSVRRRRR